MAESFVQLHLCRDADDSEIEIIARATCVDVVKVVRTSLTRPTSILATTVLGFDDSGSLATSAFVKEMMALLDESRPFQVSLDGGVDMLTDAADVSNGVDAMNNSSQRAPELVEACQRLVYELCAMPTTGCIFIEYLRDRGFFRDQLEMAGSTVGRLTVNNGDPNGASTENDKAVERTAFVVRVLHQRAWLLKSLAIELHHSALAPQGLMLGRTQGKDTPFVYAIAHAVCSHNCISATSSYLENMQCR